MDILLCTPYNINHSGIAIWAQNIMSHYRTLNTDTKINVVAYDRKNGVKTWLLKRVWNAVIDYYRPIKETRKELGRCQYDILHLCTSASISLLKDILVLNMATRKGVKTVIHFHFGRISEISLLRNWEWLLLQKVVKMADVAVTMDIKSYETLHECGFCNIAYLPNPLSRSIIQQIELEGKNVQREPRKLCFVGHVIPSKGVMELVAACKGICGIELHIFGMGSDVICQRMKNVAGNESWLVFEGEVDHRRVIREMLSSAIFVLPTYTEGFPNVILESMACGCAIVTTPVGAIPEMLDITGDNPCGLCSPPKDVEGLRRNIKYFLENTECAQQYSDRAKKRVGELYVIEKVWKDLMDIWESLCHN